MPKTNYDVLMTQHKLITVTANDIKDATFQAEWENSNWKVVDCFPSENQGDSNGN